MVKQVFIYLVLSVLVVFFASYVSLLMVYVDLLYTITSVQLVRLFGANAFSLNTRNSITLAILPLIIAGIPAIIWRLIKGKVMPYFVDSIWLLWTLIVVSRVLVR